MQKSTIFLGLIGLISLSVAETNNATLLQESIVSSEKQEMTFSPDGKSVTINEAMSAGKTARDLLLELPSVSQDQKGNLKIRGSTGVKILINGRPAEMDDIDNLAASSLEKIEVITSPRANMDAEGKGGVISIRLKQVKDIVPRGQFLAAGGWPKLWQASEEFGTPLGEFGKQHHLGIWERYEGRSTSNDLEETTVRSGVKNGQKVADIHNETLMNQMRFGLEHLGQTNQMNLSFKAAAWKKTGDEDQKIYTLPYDGQAKAKSHLFRYGGEIGFFDNLKLGATEHELRLDLSTNNYQADRSYHRLSVWNDSNLHAPSLYDYSSDINSQTSRATLSYFYPFEWALGEIGTSGLWRTTSSSKALNNTQKQIADYEWNSSIGALWLQLKSKPGIWEYHAGLRYEIDTAAITEVNAHRDHQELFPSAEIKWKSDENSEFRLSYNKRIDRPAYFMLYPNWIYSTDLHRTRGNPELEPEITHQSELGYSYQIDEQKSLALTAFSSYNLNNIERVKRLDGDTLSTEYLNTGDQSRYGLESFTSYRFNKKFFSTLSGSFWRENTMTSANEHKAWSGNAKCLVQYKPTSIWLFSWNTQWNGIEHSSQTTTQAYWSSDVGANYLFAHKKGTISFRIKELPWGNHSDVTTQGINFQDQVIQQDKSAQFILQISYKFGAQNKKETPEKLDDESD